MRGRTRGVAFAVSATMLAHFVAPCAAAADALSPEQVQHARAAFKDGLAMEEKGDYAGALSKFRETAAIKATAPVEFHVALCEAKLKQYVAALADLQKAEVDAKASKNAEVEAAAPKLASEIQPLVPKVTFAASSGSTIASIVIDDQPVDVLKLAEAVPLDPGAHTAIAKDANGTEKKADFTLADGEAKTITFAFDAKPTEDVGPLPPPPIMPSDESPPPKHDSGSTQRTAGLIVGGVGVVSLGVGLTFLLMRNSKVSSLDSQCVDLKCPSSVSSDIDAAKTDVTISRIAFGVGVVSLGVGAYLYLTAKKDDGASTKTGVRFVPAAPGAIAGAGFLGVF